MPTVPTNINQVVEGDEFHAIYIITELFGNPLYAYYIVVIERYQPGDIEGTLMTPPFDISGPFTTLEEASNMVKDV